MVMAVKKQETKNLVRMLCRVPFKILVFIHRLLPLGCPECAALNALSSKKAAEGTTTVMTRLTRAMRG